VNSTTANLQQLSKTAFSALLAGNAGRAKDGFEQIVSTGQGNTMHWMGLAISWFKLGDYERSLSAADRSLELEPRNLRSVLLKADLLSRKGESRPALQHYKYGLKLAAEIPNLPADIQPELNKAQKVVKDQEDEYRDFLLERLQADGFDPGASHPRFRESLDLIFGKKQIYYQQPRRFHYPGLPQIQFYERDQFDWVPRMEASTDRIRQELIPVMQDPSRFSPYVRSGDAKVGQNNQGLADNSDWGALYLWEHSKLVPENAALFPETIKALADVPMPEITMQAPMALFSKLAPGMRIPPHNGLMNTRLICHLPLIVPPDCGALRVGNEQRPWVEGEILIFDDSIEHEAWNNSNQERVILLFEIWRPEISQEEREILTATLKAVKEYADLAD
jgi:aspartyl/asparaginyl beta-hydroxylase (cupin superfamily)